MCVLILFTTFV